MISRFHDRAGARSDTRGWRPGRRATPVIALALGGLVCLMLAGCGHKTSKQTTTETSTTSSTTPAGETTAATPTTTPGPATTSPAPGMASPEPAANPGSTPRASNPPETSPSTAPTPATPASPAPSATAPSTSSPTSASPATPAPSAVAAGVVDPGGPIAVTATKPGLTRVGPAKCKLCHSLQYTSWSATAHAKRTPPLDCESCHGPGSEYSVLSIMKDAAKARAAGLVIPDRTFCVTCHQSGFTDDMLARAHAHKAATGAK